MSELDPKIAELEARLNGLVRTQIGFQSEIALIRGELSSLRAWQPQGRPNTPGPLADAPAPAETTYSVGRGSSTPLPATAKGSLPHAYPAIPVEIPPPTFGAGSTQTTGDPSTRPKSGFSNFASKYAASARGDLEKFIGENLISLIGIIVLVLGVGIGAKYAVDNGWVSPSMRIVFGYTIGLTLTGVAVWLKAKYRDFSAVLLSGGMAAMYFVTYFGYAYYTLMPQSAAFALMAIFTVFTVAAALIYERQVIAHIGLVGAYAVPFLLTDGSGNYFILFTYMAIINVGVLVISVMQKWKLLYYNAFVVTWLIYFAWFTSRYSGAAHFYLGLTFAAVFFAIFYLAKLIHGFVHSEHEYSENSVGILTNSIIFYGFGMAIMDSRVDTRPLEGLFTAGHAVLHSVTAQLISRFRPNATGIVRALAVLIITFATVAIPAQFDGRTVTLIWSVEAAVLFWIGRTKGISIFHNLAFPLMVLATLSLFADWATLYAERTNVVSVFNRRPLANGDFVTALIFVAAFGCIWWINRSVRYGAENESLRSTISVAVGVITVFVLYNLFRIEIGNYYHLQLVGRESVYQLSSLVEPTLHRSSDDLVRFNAIWQLNYTMAFLAALGAINVGRLRSVFTTFAGFIVGIAAMALFLTAGMYLLYELRVSYMVLDPSVTDPAGIINIAIRYVTYLFAAALLTGVFLTVRSEMFAHSVSARIREIGWDAILCTSIWIVASCELINLMAQVHIPNSTKLGLSILWGVYALSLIAIGIAWKKKHLRVGAILLLIVTLIKLFLYDVADLPTIPKTILFISLGILLLIISFLYNKFTARIFGQPQTSRES